MGITRDREKVRCDQYLAVTPDAPCDIWGSARGPDVCDAASGVLSVSPRKSHAMETPSVHSLEQHGFRLMDSVLDFTFDYRRIAA